MTDNFFDDNWTEIFTAPIKRVSNTWESFSDGGVPVREGAMGELTLNARNITDEKFKLHGTQQKRKTDVQMELSEVARQGVLAHAGEAEAPRKGRSAG